MDSSQNIPSIVKLLVDNAAQSWQTRSSFVSGIKRPCPALFFKLSACLPLIKDCKSLTLLGCLTVLGGVLPSVLYREISVHSSETPSFIWSGTFMLFDWVFLPPSWPCLLFSTHINKHKCSALQETLIKFWVTQLTDLKCYKDWSLVEKWWLIGLKNKMNWDLRTKNTVSYFSLLEY